MSNSMSQHKILLTGSGGFIGRNILEQLGTKYQWLAPRSTELNLLDGEAAREYLDQEKPDIILHAAGSGVSRGQPTMGDIAERNLRMFFNLTRNKEYFGRLIVLGSGAEYDKSRSIIKIKEEQFDEFIPKDQYGFAKYVMAKYAEQTDYITHLRLFGVYGKYEDYATRFISNMICRALYDLPLAINQDAIFDYLYIDDLVRILDMMIEAKPRKTFYNLGRGEGINLKSIAEMVNRLMGKGLPLRAKQEGLNREYTCDTGRFKNEFGDFGSTDFEKSAKEMIGYYQSILNTIDKETLA